jgi:hypothetical protein
VLSIEAIGHNSSMFKPLLSRFTRSTGVALPDKLWDEALAALPFTQRLDTDQRARLRELAGQLLAGKEMSTAGDLELTAAMQINIAAQACLPILELGLDWYRGWTSIVVYPGEFLVPRQMTDDDGIVHEYVEPISGEAWDGGPLLLSWDDAQRTLSDTGTAYSVVIHEFVHKIDQLNGEANGTPPFSPKLHPALSPLEWTRVLDDAFDRIVAELELIESEFPSHLDPDSPEADHFYRHLPFDAYAVQDEAEFFAVSAEAFFVDPARLQRALPDWYAQLALFFRQDPLA